MADVTSFANASTTPGTNASLNSISILGTGLLSTADDSFRNSIALAAKFYSDITAQDTVGGTGDTITVTTPTLYAALAPIRLLFTASAANTTAVTLNLDGLGAKAVRKISGGTDVALIAGDIPAGARVDVVYSAAANSAAGGWIIIGSSAGLPAATNAQAATATSTTVALTPANLAQERGFSNDPFINLSLSASVGSSALTIAVKGQDGNDPSATNPVYVSFRSATLTSGLNAQLAITSALSLVISSGSTLGMTSAVAATLAIGIVNDAGTARLAIQNPTSLPLVDGIVSTTAEGGAGAADSAGVFYTGTAATSKAITYVGFAIVTEATAGTWATTPSVVQVANAAAATNAISPGGLKPGSATATTSGTSVPFPAIPPWVKRITAQFAGVSTNGTSNILLRVGSGSTSSSGYLGSTSTVANGNVTAANLFTTGISFTHDTGVSATSIFHGSIVLSLLDSSTNAWVVSGILGRSETAATHQQGYSLTLAGALDRVVLTTANGTDAFDAGKMNIILE